MTQTFTRIFLIVHLGICCLANTRASCIDSLRIVVKPVKCYGSRDGVIKIEYIRGGDSPYYFSIDGTSFSTKPEFDLLKPGVYTLFLRDANGCVHQETLTVAEPEPIQLHLFANPPAPRQGAPVEIKVQIAPDTTVIQDISWRPPQLFPTQQTLQQQISLHENTTIALTVSDQKGCTASAQVFVPVEKINVFIPNAFRPGSNQNAFFTVFAGEAVVRITYLQIYQRSGGLVFERNNFFPNDPLQGWDGRAATGRYVQNGVYPYLAEIELLDGSRQQFHGEVSVLR